MAGSTAPVFKAALVDLLTAAPNLGGATPPVQVSYGFLPRDVERETIVVGNINWDTDEWFPLGAQKRNEVYGVSVYVFAQVPGGTQKEATERALELMAEIETLLQVPANITLAGIQWLSTELVQVSEAPYDEGHQAMAEASVLVRARK